MMYEVFFVGLLTMIPPAIYVALLGPGTRERGEVPANLMLWGLVGLFFALALIVFVHMIHTI